LRIVFVPREITRQASMSIKLQLPKLTDLKPRITVVGVGGAGGNALNNMITSGLTGVEFVAANTDAQALAMTGAEHRIQLGVNLTEGLGAGSKPEIGEAAAEEAVDDIRQQLSGSHMCFIAAGMGGGTGTGAAAVIARIAKELGILTVGVVTKPFQFEGARRMRMAEAGIVELRKHVDTLIVIPNQNLFRIATERTTFADAFLLADQVLHSGVACVVDLIVREGLINLDFADVRTVMANMGNAMMGTGEGSGDRRAIEAAEAAIHNPLIDDISLKGAKGLLLSVTGGRDLTLYEVDEAASRVRQEVDPDANIIVGATFDDSLTDKVRVSIVASGITRVGESVPEPRLSRYAQPASVDTVSGPVFNEGRRHPTLQSNVDSPSIGVAQAPHPVASHGPGIAALLAEDAPLDLGEDIAPEASQAEWKGPGDVSIVENMPQLSTTSARPANTSEAPSIHATRHQIFAAAAEGLGQPRQDSPLFRPSPPADARQMGRRMPEVADFPPVGQREYLARTQHVQSPGPEQAVANRKPRFLERWAKSLHRHGNEIAPNAMTPDSAAGAGHSGADEPQQKFGAPRQPSDADAKTSTQLNSEPDTHGRGAGLSGQAQHYDTKRQNRVGNK
jgi:cell division protein FtsZ